MHIKSERVVLLHMVIRNCHSAAVVMKTSEFLRTACFCPICFAAAIFSVICLYAGMKADSDMAIIENDSESKGNNDKEWDKDYSLTSEEDSSNKNNGVYMTEVLLTY
jgi:hypothetical protein